MKKKLLSVVLAGAMTVSLAGCGGGSTPTDVYKRQISISPSRIKKSSSMILW